jgi:lipase chaperone LimK
MREEIKVIKIYKYEELTEEQKQKVLSKLWDLNVDLDWWIYTYEDAERIGLKINGFDIDRGSYCEIKPLLSYIDIADQIIKDHGDQCETYIHAEEFLKEYNPLLEQYEEMNNDCTGNYDYNLYQKIEDQLVELKIRFLSNLRNDYLTILRNEYEYLTSREAIEETINCNEYEFTEEGDIY